MSTWWLLLACTAPQVDNPFAFDDDGDGWSEYDGDCNDMDPLITVPSGESCDDYDGDWFYSVASGGFDCNDLDADINPFATEIETNHVDEDCDGVVPVDMDDDGFRAISSGGSDCDDEDPNINPRATEDRTDDIDQDCDGIAELDLDDDGYDSVATGGGDCDDDDPLINPGAFEDPTDEVDNDCDGILVVDKDLDDYEAVSNGGEDCDDDDASINPGAVEICGNGIDEDCQPDQCELLAEEDLGFADLLLEGSETAENQLGAVLIVSDLDGDGVDDGLVSGWSTGTWLWRGPLTATGETSVWDVAFTTSTSTLSAATTATWPEGTVLVGWDGSRLGAWSDVLDGTLDLLVPEQVLTSALTLTGTSRSLHAADLDGDGLDEVVAGSGTDGVVQWWDDGGLLGSSTGDGGLGERLGSGDVDGDGYVDLLVGSPDASAGNGSVYVLAGPISSSLPGPVATWTGPTGAELGGGGLAVGHSVTGSGNTELVLAGPGYDRGMIWVVPAAMTGTNSVTDASLALRYGWNADGRMGEQLLLTDLDADGQLDLYASTPYADAGADAAGGAGVFLGPLTGSMALIDADHRLTYDQKEAYAGVAIAVGDLNDDDWLDLFVGMPGAEDNAGRLAVITGEMGE